MDPETLDSRYNLSVGIARPSHQVEAQFSVRYLIGCALALGGVGIDEINVFTNPKVLAASELVTAESRQGVAKGWAEIEVVCVGGKTASAELESPFGSPDNPLSIDQLKDKFRDCAAHAAHPTPKAMVEKMIAMILSPDALTDSADLIKLSLVSK
jgi:2-methylcitrate dehydratase PrpD